MTREEFMKHAADAAYMGDESLLEGYVKEVFAELESLREEVESHRDAGGYAFRGGYIEDASGGRWWGQSHMSYARAEIEMLRGVGCREAKLDEPESGPCGVCLRCAEERGATWALDAALDKAGRVAGTSQEAFYEIQGLDVAEVCRRARRER